MRDYIKTVKVLLRMGLSEEEKEEVKLQIKYVMNNYKKWKGNIVDNGQKSIIRCEK